MEVTVLDSPTNQNPYAASEEHLDVARPGKSQASPGELIVRLMCVLAGAIVGPVLLTRFLFRSGLYSIDIPARIALVFLPPLFVAACMLIACRKRYWRRSSVILAVGASLIVGFGPIPAFIVARQIDAGLPPVRQQDLPTFAIVSGISLVLLLLLAVFVGAREPNEPTTPEFVPGD